MKSKTAIIIGGAFNPITNAHLAMGDACLKAFPNADIYFVPTKWKFSKKWKTIVDDEIFNDENRIRFLEAIKTPFFISRIEQRGILDGKTIHTVEYFKNQLGYENVYICVGADKIEELPRWYMIEELLQTVSKVLLFNRSGKSFEELKNENEWFGQKRIYEHFQEMKLSSTFQDMSSTKAREAYHNQDFKTLQTIIPQKVFNIIQTIRR